MNELHSAAARGDTRTVKLRLDKGADVNALDEPHSAAARGHAETVKLLLDRGAGNGLGRPSNSKDDAELLCWATGSAEVVKLLLNKGANVNARIEAWMTSLETRPTSLHGATALHHAAEHGESETVKVLVDRGADVNVENYKGETPLHLAVTALARTSASATTVVKRYTEVVAILKARGGRDRSPGNPPESTRSWWRRALGR